MNAFPESHAKLILPHEFRRDTLLQDAISSSLLPKHLQNQNYIRYHDSIPRSSVSRASVHSGHDMSGSKPLSKEATKVAILQGDWETLSSDIVRKLEKALRPQLSTKYRMHVDSTSRSSTSLWDQSSYYVTSAVIGHILLNEHQKIPAESAKFRLSASLGSEQTATFQRLTAVYEQTSADVMLTSFAADMRLKSGIIQAKETEYEDALGTPMQIWIRKTQSAIAQGGRIRAHSPIVKVTIPQFLRYKGEATNTAVKKEQLRIKKDVTAVPYFFASVEHRQAIPMNFEGFPLVLTNREGGKLGGRGYELKLSTKVLWLDGDEAKRKAERETFYQAAYRLARLVDQAARGYLPLPRTVSHTSKHEQQADVVTPKESDSRMSAPQMLSLDDGDITQEEHVRSPVEDVPCYFEYKKQCAM